MASCYHTGCRCSEQSVDRAGQKFCSNHCADSATQSSLADAMCACGHGECAGSVAATPS
jgi:hypothetical protein